MQIALVGYGKMGKIIEDLASDGGHTICSIIDPHVDGAFGELSVEHLKDAEVVIDFTHPSVALEHIRFYSSMKIPAVIGTTGWYENLHEVASLVAADQSTILYSGNFSLGVALFLRSVSYAASLFGKSSHYDAALIETHHNQKADSPSGTAVMLANEVLSAFADKKRIDYEAQHQKRGADVLHVSSLRVGSVPGTHTVIFDCPEDTVELTHTARSRNGFATGALAAAAWLIDQKPGLYTLEDMVDAVFLKKEKK